MNMLHVAMLGFSHGHARGYAQRLIEHPEAEIQCIWDDDAIRGEWASEQYHAPYRDDLEQVLSSADVDAVVINAPTAQHPMVIKAALKHGKHIYTEKALTITTREADELVKLVNESSIKFMISQ